MTGSFLNKGYPRRRAFASGCVVLFAAAASAQTGQLHGVLEQYSIADPGTRGVNFDQRYASLQYDISGTVSAVVGAYQIPGVSAFDEVYLSYRNKDSVLRVGRFRSAFGFSSWSELYYNPIIAPPLLRSYGTEISPWLELERLDRGVDYSGGSPAVQYQVALVDTDEIDWQVTPTNLDTAIGRLQFGYGPYMLGVSGLAKYTGEWASQERVAGVDFRWTAPRLQVRGEAITGANHGHGASGYYIDGFYRPPKLARTQVGVRYQGITSEGDGLTGDVCTLGLRQFLTKYFTLNLNYGFGSHLSMPANNEYSSSDQWYGSSDAYTGWSFELLSSYKF